MLTSQKEKIELRALGEPILISMRQSDKAKRIEIKFTYKEVELVFPHGASKSQAVKFLLSKEWAIREKLKIYDLNNKNLHDKIPILGELHDVKHVSSENLTDISLCKGLITIHSPQNNASDILREYLKYYALKKITKSTEDISLQHRFQYKKILIKEMSSRWGSCSSNGNLSFNWRIIFAPHDVLNYLITHELCHLLEMNHSKNFWTLVKKIDPNYLNARRWLKQNGCGLYKYLPSQ